MTDEQKKDMTMPEETTTSAQATPTATDAPTASTAPVANAQTAAPRGDRPQADRPRGRRPERGGKRGGDSRRKNFKREKPEFEQKIISLRRVTRVTSGGRRFSFSAGVVIGDRAGRVAFGLAKANDTAAAIDKAVRAAKKDMITLKLTPTNSIPFDVQAKYKASEVLLRPVTGKGLAAGGGVRTVLELAGVDEVGGKLLTRSKNNINNARVTIKALRTFSVKK